MSPELSAIICGLAAAMSWGTGDFSGGLATKKVSVYSVIFISQLFGCLLLILLALLFQEKIPSPDNLVFGGIAGISGAFGLVALYRGLALNRMGFVAPIAAVVTAIFPILAGIFFEGLPSRLQMLGFAIAVLAIWFLSTPDGKRLHLSQLKLPIAAGLCFGLFFILIDKVSDQAILWPLVSARIGSTSIMFIVMAFQRPFRLTTGNQLHLIILAGIFDVGGNAFFALATRIGRLDISAVLSSMYPAATVFLAWIILKEKLIFKQWLGVTLALLAITLIAI